MKSYECIAAIAAIRRGHSKPLVTTARRAVAGPEIHGVFPLGSALSGETSLIPSPTALQP